MPSAVPRQMSVQKALVQDAKGEPVLVDDAPLPKLGPGDILVKTMMVALNPFDYKMPAASSSKGAVMGNDFVGTVVQIHDEEASTSQAGSDDDTRIQLGDTVCGTVHGSNAADPTNGSFAEYIRVPADLVLRVPASFKPQDAATLGCALGTAIVALWDTDGLDLPISPVSPAPRGSDEAFPVLVYGGSTASGTMALQLLRLSGANPLIATCSPRNFDLARFYGATSVYDYTDPETPSRIRAETGGDLEHVLDTITDAGSVACCEAALSRSGGVLATLERCPDELRTRRAVDARFVIALEVFGKGFDLGPEGYARPASDEKRKAAARWFRVFQRLLDDGELRAHPVKVLEPGFGSIIKGLELLKSRSVSGYKLVVPLHP
ncbi:zinc-binding dehydrogenase [Diaporthe sp. PMI_573]|nr:zinc-binding dehydrogenase [Diaporthaceae sp. PMI_573]